MILLVCVRIETRTQNDLSAIDRNRIHIADTVNTKAKQYQECETLITRIEVRIMRLEREKGERETGCVASHPESKRT